MQTQKLVAALFIVMNGFLQLHAQSSMQMISKYTGDWKAEYTMWMDTSSASMTYELSVHSDMIMNNLFLTSHFTGNVMGMNYEGINTIGFDSQKGIFQSTWIDNMNSGISYLEGKAGGDGKSIEFRGTVFDAISGKDVPVKQVITLVDDMHEKIEMITMVGGKEMKTLEINLVKR